MKFRFIYLSLSIFVLSCQPSIERQHQYFHPDKETLQFIKSIPQISKSDTIILLPLGACSQCIKNTLMESYSNVIKGKVRIVVFQNYKNSSYFEQYLNDSIYKQKIVNYDSISPMDLNIFNPQAFFYRENKWVYFDLDYQNARDFFNKN